MASKAGKRRQRQRMWDALQVVLPQRDQPPESVVANLGPTNSGKTHDALEFLAQQGSGCFAAPLRMLAHEAFARLRDTLGPDAVGLRTGEERINANARILCCTAELAPTRGEVLVLDECHWAADDTRGWAWTRLLAGAQYRHLRLLGSPDVLPLLQSAFSELEVRYHARLGALDWSGAIHWQQLTAGDVVVAFSRRSVIYLASRLAEFYGADQVACLYGAMPPSSRRVEMERVRSGAAAICVATDVIGHGINLPARRVIFAETAKYDGDARRSLRAWEAAQVAGRAGRFGLTDGGQVGVLAGMRWFEPQSRAAQSGLQPKIHLAGDVWAFGEITHGWLRPSLADLRLTDPVQLAAALAGWQQRARQQLADHPWVMAENLTPLLDRIGVAAGALRSRTTEVALSDLWQLATSPTDAADEDDRQTLGLLARSLLEPADTRRLLGGDLRHATLAQAELAARRAAQLRWWAHLHPDTSVSAAEAEEAEYQAGQVVLQRLSEELANPSAGRCAACGRECAPWHRFCELCA